MYYSEHVQTWLTAKESFWPEWCSCNWNTGGRSPVQVSPSGIFYESDGEWLPSLFLWTYWTHILIQVHVFGTLHVKMSKCALNLKASSSKTSDRKSGRKAKIPFVIGLTTDNLRLYVLRRNSWNWTVNWYLFISRATSSHKYS